MSQVVGEDMVTDMGFIGLEPGKTYQMGPAAVEKTASGNLIMLEDSLARPVKEMAVYGRSEQVVTTGAQLLPDAAKNRVNRGVNCKIENNSVYFDGTVNDDKNFRVYIETTVELSIGTYYLSVDNENIKTMFITKVGDTETYHPDGIYTVDGTENFIYCRFLVGSKPSLNGDVIKETAKIMLNTGSLPLPFEPYTGGKPSPSLEYPQEINSVGDRGEIGVKVTGKNLFDIGKTPIGSNYGVDVFIEGEEVVLNGVSEKLQFVKVELPTALPPDTYTITVVSNKDEPNIQVRFYNKVQAFVKPKKGTVYAAFKTDSTETHMQIRIAEGVVLNDLRLKIQVEKGKGTGLYEPYKSQSVTIPTPTGLPGIPVDSGGNYTDENGQQWVCDTIECVDGQWQYMKRIGVETLNSLKMSTETTDVPGRFAAWDILSAFGSGKQKSISNMFQWERYGTMLENRCSFAASGHHLYISPPKDSGYTLDTLNAYLAEHITADTPLIIYGQLETPVIIPLTAARLSTYKPTTVISNDAGAEMTMTYKAKKG